MSRFRLVARHPLPPPGPGDDAEPRTAAAADAGTAALDRILAARHRLPTFVRDHTYHEGEPRLQPLLRPLQGKFSVINTPLVLPLPPRLAPSVGRMLARRSARGHAAAALSLHEPLGVVIRHEDRSGGGSSHPGRDILFWAELRYRLLVESGGAAAPPTDPAAGARRLGSPVAWFHVAVLMPDAEARDQMAPATAHFYLGITGRLGGNSTDRYWFGDSWQRFHEEGRVIGCLSPSLVEHGHVGGALRRRDHRAAGDADAAAPFDPVFGDASGERSHFVALTPEFQRRGFVPPGYCLVHYFASVELAVDDSRHHGAAA